MKLTSGMIFQRLSKNFQVICPQKLKQNRVRVVYFDEQDYLDDCLYILSGSTSLEACFSTKAKSVFLLCQKPSEIPADCSADFLFCADAPDPCRLFNAVNAIFTEFNDWEQQLYRCPCTPDGVQQLLVLGKRYLKGRLSLSDIYLNYIMSNSRLQVPDSGTYVSDHSKITDEEAINDLIDDPEFHQCEKETNVFFYSSIDYSTLCYNLFQNNRFCYRLIYNNFKNTYSEEEFYLFEYLGEHARDLVAYIPSMTAPIPLNNPVRNSIYRIIAGKQIPQQLLQAQLSEIGWHPMDEYVLIRMDYYFINSEYDIPLQHALQLEHRFVETIAVKYQDGLLFLLNISCNPSLQNESFLPAFSVFIRDTMYKCGISAAVRGFSNLYYALEQANFALTYGLAHYDTFWYFKFEDYCLEYIKEQATEKLPAEFTCHPGLFRLKDYDEKNETDLYHTLFVYLKHSHNLNEVARILHVHRTTLLYRIQKIELIAGTDLKNWKIKLHLMISYLILGES